ncbi:MAG: helix-hairpin-helix domain-containing protein [Anaerolineales bacterium]|nr:helix-hairpin-helix domain-containing protein [Anaerolineales bacterium]
MLAGVLVFVSRAFGQSTALRPAPTDAPIAIHVIGAVPRRDYMNSLKAYACRARSDAAGGLLPLTLKANVDALNLAALLEDGQQLNIPYKAGSEPVVDPFALDLPSSATATPLANPDIELININTATLETSLIRFRALAPTTALKILDYRAPDANGPFATIEDIMNVSVSDPPHLKI